jgi:hypothetical protein
MKRGDKFIHRRWLDENNQPLKCEVTRVARGLVYWKAEGERKAKHYFRLEEADKYVRPSLSGDASYGESNSQ